MEPTGPPTDECINGMWSIHTVEYYWAIKRNEALSLAATWMNLENMLRERSQSQETVCISWLELPRQRTTDWATSITELYCLPVPGGWRSKLQGSAVLLAAGTENVLCDSPPASGGCWPSLACLGLWQHPSVSAFIFTWRSPCVQISSFCKDTSHVGLAPLFP